VIGGLLAFGVIGLFVGPVVLAVTFTLMQAWVAESDPAAAPITVARKPAAGSPPQKRQRKS
jgi:predicted PurR-regulated permease PerM